MGIRPITNVTPSAAAPAAKSRGKAVVRELWTSSRTYWVYIVANATRLLYIGVTANLFRRMWQHQTKAFDDGYTTHWNVCRLVYSEPFERIEAAIAREKQLKRWRREKKIWLIESVNPNWHDLSACWYDQPKVVAPRLAAKATRSG